MANIQSTSRFMGARIGNGGVMNLKDSATLIPDKEQYNFTGTIIG